ncbi:MAG TPA: hypothetical protein VK892_00910 [Pyrinomonadaceae bacterium]|nr:hypothetical protein [Pyrinomonadaceae bacterium]
MRIAGTLKEQTRSLKASNIDAGGLFVAFSDRICFCALPSDSRWAILFVAFGDRRKNWLCA